MKPRVWYDEKRDNPEEQFCEKLCVGGMTPGRPREAKQPFKTNGAAQVRGPAGPWAGCALPAAGWPSPTGCRLALTSRQPDGRIRPDGVKCNPTESAHRTEDPRPRRHGKRGCSAPVPLVDANSSRTARYCSGTRLPMGDAMDYGLQCPHDGEIVPATGPCSRWDPRMTTKTE